MRWASGQEKYRALVDLSAGKAPAILDNLPSTIERRRTDALEADASRVRQQRQDRTNHRCPSQPCHETPP